VCIILVNGQVRLWWWIWWWGVRSRDRQRSGCPRCTYHTISSHCGGSKRSHVRETVMRRWWWWMAGRSDVYARPTTTHHTILWQVVPNGRKCEEADVGQNPNSLQNSKKACILVNHLLRKFLMLGARRWLRISFLWYTLGERAFWISTANVWQIRCE
jgi:hypothetical protein